MGQYADDQPLLSLAALRPLFAVLNIRSAFRFHSADLLCVLRDRCTAPIIPQEGGGCTGGTGGGVPPSWGAPEGKTEKLGRDLANPRPCFLALGPIL